MEHLVVIPYLSRGAQGRELVYAVEGWKQHFKEPCYIVIVGDYDKNVAEVMARAKQGEPSIEFIPCPRIAPVEGQYTCHLDHVHKFRKVHEQFPESKGFIYACDDMYAVHDFVIGDVKYPKLKSLKMTARHDSGNAWQRDLAKTRDLCEKEGLPIWNWICHLPVYYEWDKLFAIYDKYDCDSQSYVVENLYFNTYHESPPFPIDYNMVKFTMTDNSREAVAQMNKAEKEKIWITNTPEGWCADLEVLLQIHYKY